MLARWPSLAKLPEGCDMDSLLPSPKELGVEVDWDSVGNLVPVNGQKKGAAQKEVKREGDVKKEELREGMPGPATEGVKIEEPEVIVEDIEPDLTWSDVALSIGADIVNKCRKDVLEQLGYTCSAGIAPNKVHRYITTGCPPSMSHTHATLSFADARQAVLGLAEAQCPGKLLIDAGFRFDLPDASFRCFCH